MSEMFTRTIVKNTEYTAFNMADPTKPVALKTFNYPGTSKPTREAKKTLAKTLNLMPACITFLKTKEITELRGMTLEDFIAHSKVIEPTAPATSATPAK